MKLSVVMAVRNGERHLREAIDSVLAQSVSDFEFLIIDDASTDRTAEILSACSAADARIRVLRNPEWLGVTASVNLALAQAAGDVIARHDSDDVSAPGRFAVQLAALASAPDVVLVTGAVDVFGPQAAVDRLTPPAWQPRLEWELLFTNAIGSGGQVMFPRLFRGAPVRYPAEYPYAQDYGLWCRLVRIGRVICPPETVYRYRRHEASISTSRKAAQDDCVAQIRRGYQAQFSDTAVPPAVVDDVARFWKTDGTGPLASDTGVVVATLLALREHFLNDIEARYGADARATLDAQVDEALRDRLGYWLYRSLKSGDSIACARLLSIAAGRREGGRIAGLALGRIAAAVRTKLTRRPVAGMPAFPAS